MTPFLAIFTIFLIVPIQTQDSNPNTAIENAQRVIDKARELAKNQNNQEFEQIIGNDTEFVVCGGTHLNKESILTYFSSETYALEAKVSIAVENENGNLSGTIDVKIPTKSLTMYFEMVKTPSGYKIQTIKATNC